MSVASIKRNALRTLLVFHLFGVALVIGIRVANFAIQRQTTGDNLALLSYGRDTMGGLARGLTLPGFLLTIATGVGMVWLRYGKRVPSWVWMKIGLTTAALSLATPVVAPALEAARKWAHWSVEHGQLAPQFHDSAARASLYGGIVLALFLVNIPLAVWKPLLSVKMPGRSPAGALPEKGAGV